MPPHGNFAQTKNQTKISHEVFFTTAFFFFVRSPFDLLILPPLNLQASKRTQNRPRYYSFQQGLLKLFSASFICLATVLNSLLLLVTLSAFLQHKQDFV